jgi:hypothetical protein
MADLNLQKVDLSSIKAIAHDGVSLNVLIERNGGYCLKSLPAPEQAFQGLLQLAALFTALLQQSDNGLTARTQLLDQIRMIPVNSSNVAAIGYCDVCRILQVDFSNRKRYRYQDVPSQVFDSFLAASSKGRFLNSVIKSEFGFDFQLVQ